MIQLKDITVFKIIFYGYRLFKTEFEKLIASIIFYL